MDAGVLFVFISVYVLGLLVFLNYRRWTNKPKPPGPWGFPIVGHLPLFGDYFPATLDKWRRQYGDVFRIRIGSWDSVVINGYSTIKDALETRGDVFSGRPDFLVSRLIVANVGEESLGFGKFTPAYIQHRKIVAGALRVITNTQLENTDELILEEGHAMVDELLLWQNNPNYVDRVVHDTVARILYRIVYMFQNKLDEKHYEKFIDNHDRTAKLVENGSLMDLMPWLRFIMPWKIQKLSNFIKQDMSLLQDVINECTSQKRDGPKALIDTFLGLDLPAEVADKYHTMSKSRLMGSLSDIMFAGIETTNTILQWLILYMIAYPDIQRKVQREIDDEIGRFRPVKTTDRSRLNYTWATIFEVMRHSDSVPFTVPHSTTAETEINGYHIAKDTLIMINLHSIRQDVDFWKDPRVFRPERLLDKDNCISKEMVKRIALFGLGGRKCIGENLAKMTIFLIFTSLMQRCSLGKHDGDRLSFEPVGKLSHHPKPFRVFVKERYTTE